VGILPFRTTQSANSDRNSFHLQLQSSFMATPLFANDPAFTQYMEQEYWKLHEQNLFIPDPRYNKAQAHQIAFQRAMDARRRGLI
jgi:hypothetical protein